MAAAALSIIDRLIQLINVREKNREKYFKNFIEPLYLDGEQIAKDYMGLLTELAHKIGDAKTGREIAEWLETRRTTLQPVRDKVRALMENGFMEREDKAPGDALVLFKKGLWGLMKGGVSAVGRGHALTGEYGCGDHTILDLLYPARMLELDDRLRERLARRAQWQREAIERAWRDVTEAYAELRSKYLQ
jgi:hypothetical protein